MKSPILAVPLDETEKAAIFDSVSGMDAKMDLLEKYVCRFIEKNNLEGYETGDISRRKLIAALVYAVVLAAQSAWFILYHPPAGIHPVITLGLESIPFLIFFIRQKLFRSLVRQVIRRPDDNLDNILISQVSGAKKGLANTLLMLLPIAAVLCVIFVVLQKPHMIFEKNDMGGYSVRYYTWSLNQEESVEIPQTYKGLPVNEIRGNVFRNLNFKHITLPSGLTQIRANTFEKCTELEEIVIPEGVTRIAAHAFCDCHHLQEVVVPSTVTEIGSSAFRRCYWLESIELPADVSINERAFKESPTQLIPVG